MTSFISANDLHLAVRTLRSGQLVVFPTDTVYGVAALAQDEAAVQSLYQAKSRPDHMAIPVMVASPHLVPTIALPQPGFWALTERFWPGPLTIILPKTASLPGIVTTGGNTVGLRIPDHPIALDLLRLVDAPLAVTSANRSGQPPARTAEEARAQLDGRVSIVVDGGLTPGGQPSTVLDLTSIPPRILRPGPIAATAIVEVLDDDYVMSNENMTPDMRHPPDVAHAFHAGDFSSLRSSK